MKQTNVAPKLRCEKFFNFFSSRCFYLKTRQTRFALRTVIQWMMFYAGCYWLLYFFVVVILLYSLVNFVVDTYTILFSCKLRFSFLLLLLLFGIFSLLFLAFLLIVDRFFAPFMWACASQKTDFFPSRLIQNRKLSLVRCC